MLPPDVEQIFDSFQLLSSRGAVPPLGGNEVFDQSTTASSSSQPSQQQAQSNPSADVNSNTTDGTTNGQSGDLTGAMDPLRELFGGQ